MPQKTSEADPSLFSAAASDVPSAWSLLSPGVWVWLVIKTLSVPFFLTHHRGAGLFLYFGPDPWFLYQMLAPTSSGFGRTFSSFSTAAKEVWLTIDDGPDPLTTPAILDLLDRHEARATFFAIGAQVDAYPELAREIVRRGHELGNHTQNHLPHRIWRSWPTATAEEIDQCQTAISRATGRAPTRFRAPVGLKNIFLHSLLRHRSIDFVAWSVRGFDCILKPDTAVKLIVDALRPGAIVLTHEGNGDSTRVEVLSRVLTQLTANGYRAIVPSSEALRGSRL